MGWTKLGITVIIRNVVKLLRNKPDSPIKQGVTRNNPNLNFHTFLIKTGESGDERDYHIPRV